MNRKIREVFREDNINMHNHFLDYEIESLKKLISFAERTAATNHIKFIEDYIEVIKTHKTNISHSFQLLKDFSVDITALIQKDINLVLKKEGFSFQGRTFYFSYYPNSYIFFTPLYKDEYNGKNTYGLITYKYRNNAFYLYELSIGYSNHAPEFFRDYPKDILENIDAMDTAKTTDEVITIFDKCKNDIQKLFLTSDIRRLFEIKDEAFERLFGLEPQQFIQQNHVKKDNNIIRLQLEKHVEHLTPELIDLVKSEYIILRFGIDTADDWFKTLLNEKEVLLKDNNMNQQQLDKLMSYIDVELLNYD